LLKFCNCSAINNDSPIIGTWFDPQLLLKLGKYTGFEAVEILPQPDDFPYSHYRFDLLLKKPGGEDRIG
jgi:hypothetical protein